MAGGTWVSFDRSSEPEPMRVGVFGSSTSMLEAEIEVPGLRLEKIETAQGEFVLVQIPGAGQIGELGTPLLPALRRFVEIPEKAVVRSRVDVLQWEDVVLSDYQMNVPLYPVQRPVPKCDCEEARNWRFEYRKKSYRGTIAPEIISWERPIHMRDHRMVKLSIAPVSYNAETGVLHVARRIRVRLDFDGADQRATNTRKTRLSSRVFDAFLRNAAINLNFSGDPGRTAQWHYPDDAPVEFLVITPPSLESGLADFVEWKTSCGFRVSVVTTDTTGTTKAEIKSYITSLYNGANPPVYILMIGDSPTPLVTYTDADSGVDSGGTGGTDLPFVQMDTDLYPDMIIARWPVDDASELSNMQNKILFYEQPTTANSAWLNRALFLAGDDYENHSVTTHEDVIAELMEPAPNSAECDLWHGNPDDPTTAELMTDINTGLGWTVYSAHSGPTGWAGDPPLSSSDIPTMANANMYPIGIGHSCQSNMWNDYDDVFGEVTVTQADKGFVSYWGGSNSTHWVGDDWLQRGYFDALFDTDMTGSQIPDLDGQYSNGAICYAGLTSVSLQGGDDEEYYWYLYNLDGDPTLDPFTRQPTAINVGAPSAVGPVATENFTVTVTDASSAGVDAALVAASQDGTLLGAGYTDASGTAVFHIDAPSAGSPLLVRVTAHNHVPTDASTMVGAEADGVVSLDASVYTCSSVVTIDVFDSNAAAGFSVDLGPVGGSSIAVAMVEVGDISGHFRGSATLGTDLSVSHGQTLEVSYHDTDTGGGSPADKTAGAAIDCAGPVISGVNATVSQSSIRVEFTTSESGSTVVRYGTSIPPSSSSSDATMRTSHSMVIDGLDACTRYYYEVESTDALGNTSIDNNGGAYYSVETSGWSTFFEDDFNADPGWAIDDGGNANGWAFGTPQGSDDPHSGATGDYLYGYNNTTVDNGDYSDYMSTVATLTTPNIDVTNATSLQLRFQRQLGVESSTYDHAAVQVSTDSGAQWTTVWEHGGSTLNENSWSEQILNLNSVLPAATIQIRWIMGPTDSSVSYKGWNIDDVKLEGEMPCSAIDMIFSDGFEGGSCARWSWDTGR